MNVRKILLATLILLLLPLSLRVWAGDFGQSSSLFTDIKANKVGDILTVLIYEYSNATSQVENKTQKSSKASVSGGPGLGPLDFIPLFKADGSNSSTFDGKGENLRSQTLRAKMSVTVVDMKENGDLIIQGSRTVHVSKDNETMTLTGVVRPKDVTANNTIDSYLIADAKISYTGRGPSNNTSRPGPITRFINWLF
jgi:flagellar L-ring protein precursor FlgH